MEVDKEKRSMKIKRGIAALCAGALLCGCAKSTDSSRFTGEGNSQPDYQSNLNMISPQAYSTVEDLSLEKGTYISIIGKESDSSYWKMVSAGAEQAAEDLNQKLGYSGKDKVKVVYSAPEKTEDIDEQVNILDEELARYPDAIGIACIDEEAYSTQFDQAEENGIPLVALDSSNSYRNILCISKTNNQEAAATGMSQLCDEIGNQGKILVLGNNSNSSCIKERMEGIQNELASHPEVQLADPLYYDKIDDLKKSMQEEDPTSTEGTESTENAENTADSESAEIADITDAEVLDAYLDKNSDIKGIYALDEASSKWVQSALDEGDREENPVLISFDAGKDQLKALKDGKIYGLVVQNPFGMGYAAVISAARAILGIGNEAVVDTGYVWVTKENMETESIENLLYE